MLSTRKVMRENSQALDAFMREFYSETVAHPWARGIRIWGECMMLEVSVWQEAIHLSSIMSLTVKNAGNASRCLSWLCAKADSHAVDIDLSVKPIKNAGAKEGHDLTKAQLKAWYKRHGFSQLKGDCMLRSPVAAPI
jgi:hypothetical protein